MTGKKDNPKQMELNINIDITPILYTDNILISTNNNGVVLNVGQALIRTNQVKIVSRIGMSRTHAKKVLKELGSLLAMTEGKMQTKEKEN